MSHFGLVPRRDLSVLARKTAKWTRMGPRPVIIIGVAGPTCSGKSLLLPPDAPVSSRPSLTQARPRSQSTSATSSLEVASSTKTTLPLQQKYPPSRYLTPQRGLLTRSLLSACPDASHSGSSGLGRRAGSVSRTIPSLHSSPDLNAIAPLQDPVGQTTRGASPPADDWRAPGRTHLARPPQRANPRPHHPIAPGRMARQVRRAGRQGRRGRVPRVGHLRRLPDAIRRRDRARIGCPGVCTRVSVEMGSGWRWGSALIAARFRFAGVTKC